MKKPKILKNWKVLVLSFMVAATFWFFSALGEDYDSRINYPIEFVFNRDSLIPVKPLPKYVDLTVFGGGWDLFKASFWFGNDPIIFKLANPAATKHLTKATIFSTVSEQLDEYHINFLFTDTLTLNIERKLSKLVNIQIDSTQISMDEDYRRVSPIKLSPDTARIYGPSSFIDTLKNEYYIELNAKKIDKNFDRYVKLNIPDAYDIHSNPSTINTQFNVSQFDRLKIETVAETQNFPNDSSVVILNPEVTVHFVVQNELREEYFVEDFKIIVDYNLINKADSIAPAIVIFHPENIIEIETIPDSLKITYGK